MTYNDKFQNRDKTGTKRMPSLCISVEPCFVELLCSFPRQRHTIHPKNDAALFQLFAGGVVDDAAFGQAGL